MISLPVSSIHGIPVVVDIIPKGNSKVRPAHAMDTPRDVAIHNTGNNANGADALMHARYLHNNSRAGQKAPYAGWHFSVDDKRIVQHLPLNESGWHTGDGSGVNSGNRNSIGVEICENRDGDYAKAERNAVILTAYLLEVFQIGISNVRPHKFYSNKYCPHIILKRDGSLAKFKDNVQKQVKGGTIVIDDKPSNDTTVPSGLPAPRNNEGIVDYLNRVGIDSSFPNRRSIAHSLNMTNYSGTASQNTKLVQMIYSASKKKGLPAPKNGEGIVAYLNRVGINSSYSNRESLAKKHGIEGYKGTASQNNQLIQLIYKDEYLSKGSSGSSNSGIKQVGTIQIHNLNNFTYIYESTSKSSKRLGQAKKGAKFPIAGSVPNWWEVIHNGKRAYIDSNYGKRV